MVLHGQILGQILRTVARYGSRYYRLEGKAFNRLYTGFPRSKVIGRGVRHGLTVGSIAGSLINDDGTPESNNGIPQRPRSKTNRQYKTRRRFQQRTRRFNKFCPPTYNRRSRRVQSFRR